MTRSLKHKDPTSNFSTSSPASASPLIPTTILKTSASYFGYNIIIKELLMPRMLVMLAIFICSHTSAQDTALQPIDANMQNIEYPFPVAFFNTTVQGQALKMAFMDVRPAIENGKVIMLLHGKNFNGAYWETTARALSEDGYRVIIPDQVGFGKSSKPASLQFSFQLLASQTKNLLDSLGIKKLSVLGHSMGGMLASRFALMYPDKIEKLILLNPIGLEDWKLKVPYQTVDELYNTELKQTHAAIKKYQQENYYGGTWKPEYDRWVNLLAGWTLHPDYPRVAWNAALTAEMIMTQPVLYEFSHIKVPTLLIIGQRDRTALGKNLVPEAVRKTMGNYPALGKTTAARIKNSKLVALENVGHLPHIEAFDRFIKPLRNFLTTKSVYSSR
jgi:pimeloyl-ACP methyl ester carboxylesterase